MNYVEIYSMNLYGFRNILTKRIIAKRFSYYNSDLESSAYIINHDKEE